MEQGERIAYLFSAYLAQTASPAEQEELFEYVQNPAHEEKLKELIGVEWQQQLSLHQQDEAKAEAIFQNILAYRQPAQVKRLPFLRWMAAASILLVAGVGAYFYFSPKQPPTTASGPPAATDVSAPTAAHATITLSNGRQVLLDSTAAGTAIVQGDARLVKTAEGAVVYSGEGAANLYNTLTNPRGSRVVNMVLSDGTKVWLNSESSLHYPVAFKERERRVQISGEAYFEVAHNPARPFVVEKGDVDIRVLGTHFNVNAFEDEGSLKVTLLQGKVRVGTASEQQVLAPGQQAAVQSSGAIAHNKAVDLDAVMAWKNGSFSFRNADLQTIMRQLSRWYNITVRYEGKPPTKRYNGEIGRDLSLKQVLEGLQFSNVSFRLEGTQLTILP